MIAAILLAAGKGHRSGLGYPKPFFKLDQQSLLVRAVARFIDFKVFAPIVVVLPSGKIDQRIGAELEKLNEQQLIRMVSGGQQRWQSAQQGAITALELSPEWLLFHDVARPFFSDDLLHKLLDARRQADAIAPCLPVTESLIKTRSGCVREVADREQWVVLQTPQLVRSAHLSEIYSRNSKLKSVSCEFSLVAKTLPEAKVALIAGERANIKLTYPEDFAALDHLSKPLS